MRVEQIDTGSFGQGTFGNEYDQYIIIAEYWRGEEDRDTQVDNIYFEVYCTDDLENYQPNQVDGVLEGLTLQDAKKLRDELTRLITLSEDWLGENCD